jgi:hypothetical protein
VNQPRATALHIPSGYGVPTDASGAERLPWSWAVEQLTREKYAHRIKLDSESFWIYALRPKIAQTWTEQGYPRNAVRWVFSDG